MRRFSREHLLARVLFMAALFTTGGVAWFGALRAFPVCARTAGAKRTRVLDIDYRVDCAGWKSGVTAVIRQPGVRDQEREVWVTLTEGVSRVSAWVQTDGRQLPEVSIRPEVGCEAKVLGRHFRPRVANGSDAALVLDHSPVLVARPDQINRPDNDTPLITAHQWSQLPDGGRVLRYTIYFSDEDSLSNASDELGHLEAYGRYADIEWAYEVEFDAQGKVRDRRFQSGVYSGAGHQRATFRGEFVTGTDHPILYNSADHNIFADWPALTARSGWAYQGVAEDELTSGMSRERILFQHPWIFWVSDLELAREGKLVRLSNQFQYQEVSDGRGGVKLSSSLSGVKLANNISVFHLMPQARGYGVRSVVGENIPKNSVSF